MRSLKSLSAGSLGMSTHWPVVNSLEVMQPLPTVLFGRPTRVATSVTPRGPSASAPRTSNARAMLWTLDTGCLRD